jgi:hypothetical protein
MLNKSKELNNMKDIDYTNDVIDSRDLLSYKEKLEKDEHRTSYEDDLLLDIDKFIKEYTDEFSDDNTAKEYLQFGETFINSNYFEDYMHDYFFEINQVDEALMCYVDIEQFAEDQKYYYGYINFGNSTFFYKNS